MAKNDQYSVPNFLVLFIGDIKFISVIFCVNQFTSGITRIVHYIKKNELVICISMQVNFSL